MTPCARVASWHPAPGGKPLWVRLYVQQVGGIWAAMIVADDAPPPKPGSVKGVAFLGDTAAEAERLAVDSFGDGLGQN